MLVSRWNFWFPEPEILLLRVRKKTQKCFSEAASCLQDHSLEGQGGEAVCPPPRRVASWRKVRMCAPFSPTPSKLCLQLWRDRQRRLEPIICGVLLMVMLVLIYKAYKHASRKDYALKPRFHCLTILPLLLLIFFLPSFFKELRAENLFFSHFICTTPLQGPTGPSSTIVSCMIEDLKIVLFNCSWNIQTTTPHTCRETISSSFLRVFSIKSV